MGKEEERGEGSGKDGKKGEREVGKEEESGEGSEELEINVRLEK